MELSEKEVTRISETVEMIPQDVDSILEVGCGDGRVSKFIRRNSKLTGIDIDSIRIKTFSGNRIIADISELPIRNCTFDLVLSTEVLEHLNDETFYFATSEISRVAKKYILITVPFEETLSAEWVKCSKCSHIFHAWGHVRRFNLEILKKLFDGAALIKKRFLGPKETRVPSFCYVIAKKLGNVWGGNHENPPLCPKCGSKPVKCEGNIFGKIFIRLIWRVNKVSPFKKPIWVASLYQKS